MDDLTILFPIFLIIAPLIAWYIKDKKIAEIF